MPVFPVMMHPALFCSDILYEVFGHLALRRNVQPIPWLWDVNLHVRRTTETRTLARAARVCRTFSDPALDVLWESLDSFLPLLLLYDALVKQYQLFDDYYRPVPDAAEWARFQKYAERVQYIEYCWHKDAELSRCMWEIGHSRAEPLLPRLQVLRLHLTPRQNNNLLGLISPSLRQLEVLIISNAAEHDNAESDDSGSESSPIVDPYWQFVRNVLSKAPLLQTLGIHHNYSATLLAPVVEYPHIRRLFLAQNVDLRTLHTISGAESLVELHVELPKIVISTPPRGFRNLQHLKIRGDLRAAFDFLSAISPQYLVSLKYRPRTYLLGRGDPLGCCNIVSLISDKFPSLCDVSIQFAIGAASYQRFLDGLRPLLRLRDLERVILNFNRCGLAWSDHDVCELAAAWPKLTVLQLHSAYLSSAPPKELPSIYTLAELRLATTQWSRLASDTSM
ncbi:hypothetical protein B0H21DRAFT_888176 [Amylocystis lapponica]|nr:hypothetical protein B0H21DRAFT_888176 [Amylocystis lapponica]